MSVIVRNNPSAGVGGSTSKGFPPGDISNIQHTVNDSKVLIKWTDPEDTIVDEVVFAKWKGTILVRNSGHYPNNIKDGDIVIDNTIRNKYKDIWYEDDNIINNRVYYYRFFPYSEDKVYNDSSNLIFKDKPVSFAPTLADNTWEQIAAASESGNIPSTWKVGDEIDLTLSGSFNETITLQIWDFNHFDKSDDTGKAGICFGMKHLMKNKQQMNSSSTTNGGWNATNMRNTVMNNIFNSMPAELKAVIKEVNTYANKGNNNSLSQVCTDKVFIPGFNELGYTNQNYDGNQTKFPIFSDNNSRIKKMNNGSGSAERWWTRSPCYTGTTDFRGVDTDGDLNRYVAYNSVGVCFCFNI